MPKVAEIPIPLRLVIQQVGLHPVPHYRVIVYGDDVKPRHSDFGSAAPLLDALRLAAPTLDLSQQLQSPLRDGQGSIVFDGEMLLNREQLSALGLN